MTGICDQRHRVRQKAKAGFDHHENQVERHRDGHAGIDCLAGQRMRMPMVVVVVVVVVRMIVLFHTVHPSRYMATYGPKSKPWRKCRADNTAKRSRGMAASLDLR